MNKQEFIERTAMRNRNLLDALEVYVLADKAYSKHPTYKKFLDMKEKRNKLEVVIAVETTTDDVIEMFSDLREYWDTLEVSK
jgi:hypothetical protein